MNTAKTVKKDSFLYWIWLSEACGSITKHVGRLCERFEDPFDLYRMDEEEIEHLEGVSPILRERLNDKALDGAYDILRYCRRHGVDIVTYRDTRYPTRLRTIEDPPVLLYCLGTLPDMNRRLCIGLVGTRRMSEYGKQSAYQIGYELASARAVVVSGMALGVDAVAACGALEAGGSTVAVLGCGIDTVYPKPHKRLMETIAKHGAVVTEYPPKALPERHHFPRRNRIISGLCQGTLVIEGVLDSGALITASHAIAQGRELFALPGKINEPNSDGPNELIRNGAHVARSVTDILSFYDFLYHEDLDQDALRKAKASFCFSDAILKRYGVSPDPDAPKSEKPHSEKRQPTGRTRAPKRAEPTEARDAREPAEVSPEPSVQERAPLHPDQSTRLLESVDATTRRVFSLMPADRAITPDALAAEGIDIGDVITALTLLEIVGLVNSLPGGMYARR